MWVCVGVGGGVGGGGEDEEVGCKALPGDVIRFQFLNIHLGWL